MHPLLEQCRNAPQYHAKAGTVLMHEGQTSGLIFVLVKGEVEILRGGTQVTVLSEPGSVMGEMSILLAGPHTATVRALTDADLYRFEDGAGVFREKPDFAYLVAKVLAGRLNAATTYVADLKQQFADHGTHLSMVGEVLETLVYHQQSTLDPGSDRDPG